MNPIKILQFRNRQDGEAAPNTEERSPLEVVKVRWIVAGFFIAILSIVLTTDALLHVARSNQALRMEAIKTGLTVGAGAGGIIALMLAFRRQWLNEHAQLHKFKTDTAAIFDAIERRLVDSYGKAVEQIGHEKPAVRLGGLYALENVGQQNPAYRQTVVDVICAYLRMPFEWHEELDRRISFGVKDKSAAGEREIAPVDSYRWQEFEVRRAAQNLLEKHLRPNVIEPDIYWEEIDLDLTGALLASFSLTRATVRIGIFHGAIFKGVSSFEGTTFRKGVHFCSAIFEGPARFDDFIFDGSEEDGEPHTGFFFIKTHFKSIANFTDAAINYEERSFLDASVMDIGLEYAFPLGWKIEASEGDQGKIVRNSRLD